MNILALTDFEFGVLLTGGILLPALLLINVVSTNYIVNKFHNELLNYIVQIHGRQRASIEATDERIKSSVPDRRTQLQINAVVTELLATITNEAPHRALEAAAKEELEKFESVHPHEAYDH